MYRGGQQPTIELQRENERLTKENTILKGKVNSQSGVVKVNPRPRTASGGAPTNATRAAAATTSNAGGAAPFQRTTSGIGAKSRTSNSSTTSTTVSSIQLSKAEREELIQLRRKCALYEEALAQTAGNLVQLKGLYADLAVHQQGGGAGGTQVMAIPGGGESTNLEDDASE
jgi:hypothetical protein